MDARMQLSQQAAGRGNLHQPSGEFKCGSALPFLCSFSFSPVDFGPCSAAANALAASAIGELMNG